jgi:hypothetical protein
MNSGFISLVYDRGKVVSIIRRERTAVWIEFG